MSDGSPRAVVKKLLPLRARLLAYEAVGTRRNQRWRDFPGIERLQVADAVILTFDDGPSPEGTPETLAALDRLDVRATFFLVGEQIRRHPDLAKEMVKRGHDLALHCDRHVSQDRLTEKEALADLSGGIETFESVLSLRPRWYRPPYGRCSAATASGCQEAGLEIVYWSSWGHDWEQVSAAHIAARVTRSLRPGAIVLLHDTAQFNPRATSQPTAEALPSVVGAARARGLRPTSLAGAASTVT